MTIEGMLNGVKSVNLPQAVPDIIQQTKADLILLNQLQLFSNSKDANDKSLPEYKSDKYARRKNSMNPSVGFGRPDLKNTGEFYRDFNLKVTPSTFEVDSNDVKSSDLKRKYGDAIFGLTKDNKKVYALGVFYSALQKYITFKTGLKFN